MYLSHIYFDIDVLADKCHDGIGPSSFWANADYFHRDERPGTHFDSVRILSKAYTFVLIKSSNHLNQSLYF